MAYDYTNGRGEVDLMMHLLIAEQDPQRKKELSSLGYLSEHLRYEPSATMKTITDLQARNLVNYDGNGHAYLPSDRGKNSGYRSFISRISITILNNGQFSEYIEPLMREIEAMKIPKKKFLGLFK